jgi:hypothetical protein
MKSLEASASGLRGNGLSSSAWRSAALDVNAARRAARPSIAFTNQARLRTERKPTSVESQAPAGAACRRRQKEYESAQSTPVPAAQPHASGPSPSAR